MIQDNYYQIDKSRTDDCKKKTIDEIFCSFFFSPCF